MNTFSYGSYGSYGPRTPTIIAEIGCAGALALAALLLGSAAGCSPDTTLPDLGPLDLPAAADGPLEDGPAVDGPTDGPTDGPSQDKPGQDGKPKDGPPLKEAGVLKWEVKVYSGKSMISCPQANEIAVGGGGSCPSGLALFKTGPTLGTGVAKSWEVYCETGAQGTAYIVCLRGPKQNVATVTSSTFTGATLAKKPCQSGATTLVGGGCYCNGPNKGIRHAYPIDTSGQDEWSCSCMSTTTTSQPNRAYYICMELPVAQALVTDNKTASKPSYGCPTTLPRALGGGCAGSGKLIQTTPRLGTVDGWDCDPGHEAHVYCSKALKY